MTKCRLCKGLVKNFLDLGQTTLPEEFRDKKNLSDKIRNYPLNLVYCTNCGHIQLGFKPPKDLIYKDNYFYDYSVTKTGLKHWRQLSNILFNKFNLSEDDLVIDIGSNVGTLLKFLKEKGVKILGVDPAKRLARIAKKENILTINDYFSKKVAQKIVEKYGQASLITCNNTFDHVDNLDDFIQGILILLKKKGILIIEIPYFLNMLQKLSHIPYHQQIDYTLITPLIKFLSKYHLKIIDAQKIPIHGGSIRIYVSLQQKAVSKRLLEILKEERLVMKNWPKQLNSFREKFLKQRLELISLITKLKKQGKKIAAVGASAKGITLLSYCGFGKNTIEFITEKSALKIGLFLPSQIPVVADEMLKKQTVDYAILLSWNFKQEILKNLKKYRNKGLKFIVPFPKIEII